MPNYKIHPINLGSRDMDIHDIVYRHAVGEEIPFGYGCFIIQIEEGNLIMIDSGAPSIREVMQKRYPLRIPDYDVDIIEEIKRNGFNPDDVKMIIYTHLHWDHAWNTARFPNAKLIVQEKELHSAVSPLKPARKSYGFMEESNGPDWMRSIMRFECVKGECEILPGIRVMPTPGHTAGSQSVFVDTADGTYMICGDWIMNHMNLDLGMPTGSTPDVAAWYNVYDKVKNMNLAGILPTHDPSTYSKKYYG